MLTRVPSAIDFRDKGIAANHGVSANHGIAAKNRGAGIDGYIVLNRGMSLETLLAAARPLWKGLPASLPDKSLRAHQLPWTPR